MSFKQETLTDLNSTQLEALLSSLGAPSFRAKQVQRWVYQGLANTFDEMANLPEELRGKLGDAVSLRAYNTRCMLPTITVIEVRRPLLKK